MQIHVREIITRLYGVRELVTRLHGIREIVTRLYGVLWFWRWRFCYSNGVSWTLFTDT